MEPSFQLFGQNGAPNLDFLSIDPDDYALARKTLLIMAEYLRLKEISMRCRFNGEISSAIRIEKHMEYLYEFFPDWARW